MKKLFPLLLILLLVLGCIETTIPQEKPIQLQQPEKTEVQRCGDKTPEGFCSINKPMFCENGGLIEKCSKCGCPNGLTCSNEKCVTCQPNCTTTCGGEPNGCGGTCPYKDGTSCGINKTCKQGQCTEQIQQIKCSGITCGGIIVEIVDQIDQPVKEATVALYDAKTGFLTDFVKKKTDSNGKVIFPNVEDGEYYAFAFKNNFNSKSKTVTFDSQSEYETNLKIKLSIQTAMLSLSVKNDDNQPISFAQVDVYSNKTNQKIAADLSDAQGKIEIPITEDEFYYKISKENYTPFFSSVKKAGPSELKQYKITLKRPIINRNISLQYRGLFDGSMALNTVSAGGLYTAKLLLLVPEKDYGEVGVHIRTGKENIMEKDSLNLRQIEIPNVQITKATDYDSETQMDLLDYSTTFGDAKWTNLVWIEPEPGTYEIEIPIKIKETATITDPLEFSYRAWAEISGDIERDPVDDSYLSSELYSNTYKEIFSLGIISKCQGDFCFEAEIVDIKEDLKEPILDLYQAKIFNQYLLNFVLTNNSPKIHDNANLRIENPDELLLFTDYSLTNADGKKVIGTINGTESPRLDAGNLRQNKFIKGTLIFIPQRSRGGIINFKLVSDQELVFNKNFTINTVAPKRLKIELSQENIDENTTIDLEVTVKDIYDNMGLEGATVRIENLRGDVLTVETTNSTGRTTITIPPVFTDDRIFITIEKENYDYYSKELEIIAT